NPQRRLVRDYDRARVLRQQLRRPLLIIPRKSAGTVRRELRVVRRIRIDESPCFYPHLFDVYITELPVPEHRRVPAEVGCVIDLRVSPERHIELAALIKTTKPVEAGAIQIVKQFRRLTTFHATILNQPVETIALTIEELLVVAHLDLRLQAFA